MLTRQEIFDTVGLHLLTQNRKSTTLVGKEGEKKTEICAYRGKDGCKCAAGKLIPDEEYYPSLESSVVGNANVNRAMVDVAACDTTFVRELQCVHDAQTVDNWQNGLLRVGNFYGMDVSKIRDFKHDENRLVPT